MSLYKQYCCVAMYQSVTNPAAAGTVGSLFLVQEKFDGRTNDFTQSDHPLEGYTYT